METRTIEVWTGANYIQIIQKSSTINSEVKIKVQGKKLVVRDPHIQYYQCIPIGDPVDIPFYPDSVIEDEVIESFEMHIKKPIPELTPEQKERHKVWGLL